MARASLALLLAALAAAPPALAGPGAGPADLRRATCGQERQIRIRIDEPEEAEKETRLLLKDAEPGGLALAELQAIRGLALACDADSRALRGSFTTPVEPSFGKRFHYFVSVFGSTQVKPLYADVAVRFGAACRGGEGPLRVASEPFEALGASREIVAEIGKPSLAPCDGGGYVYSSGGPLVFDIRSLGGPGGRPGAEGETLRWDAERGEAVYERGEKALRAPLRRDAGAPAPAGIGTAFGIRTSPGTGDLLFVRWAAPREGADAPRAARDTLFRLDGGLVPLADDAYGF